MADSRFYGQTEVKRGIRQIALFTGLLVVVASRSSAQPLLQENYQNEQIPIGTPIEVRLVRAASMKVGEPLNATLVYSVYANGIELIPAGSVITGSVLRLESDGDKRKDTRLNADFTPWYKPVVTFTQVALSDGTVLSISPTEVQNGSPLIHLAPPSTTKQHSRLVATIQSSFKQQKDALTGPGLGERLKQSLYRTLPYHPQTIEKGTAWTFELAAPASRSVIVPPEKRTTILSASSVEQGSSAASAGPADAASSSRSALKPLASLQLHAYLNHDVSSLDARVGEEFEATVAEPVCDADGKVKVPQGTLLIGTVTKAKAARSYGRSGVLRYDFRELRHSDGTAQNVAGTLMGMETSGIDNLKMDAEGNVTPKAQPGKMIVPIALNYLAGANLSDAGKTFSAATGSNGIGIVGNVIGIVTTRYVAAGIGFYGATLSVYRRYVRHGKDIVLAKDTRIDVAFSEQTGERLAQ